MTLKFGEPWSRTKTIVTIGILVVVGLFLAIMLIQGVQVHQDKSSIKISGGIFYSVDVPYTKIKEVELKTSVSFGTRTNGADIHSYKLGNYKNSAYGSYKLFVNTDVNKFIVIHYGEHETVVFNCKNEETTMQVYENLLEQVK